MSTSFQFCDDLGPEKIVEMYDPQTGLKAVTVIDNVAAGPSIGGVRLAPDVTVEECFRLARAMTLKNAAAGLPHGGGKSVMVGDPAAPAAQREAWVRSFANAIRDLVDYIPGPDMGTNEASMAMVKDVIGRAVGLPREIGGIPLDEIGATGFGLAVALEVAQEFSDVTLKGATAAVQGFGSVGQHAARFLAERGVRLVAASDSRGACYNPDGLDVASLVEFKQSGQAVAGFRPAEELERDALIGVECDIWIPAARPDVITADNADLLKARVVAEGANIPTTAEAEVILARRGVLVLPDFIANAGGVICGYMELNNATQSQAMAVIDEKIRSNTYEVLNNARERGQRPREAAMALAESRVRTAMTFRKTG